MKLLLTVLLISITWSYFLPVPKEYNPQRFGRTILLQAGQIHQSNLISIPQHSQHSEGSYLVHYKEVCANELRQRIESQIHQNSASSYPSDPSLDKVVNTVILSYIPHNTFLVYGKHSSLYQISLDRCVLNVGRHSPRFKVPKNIDDRQAMHFAVNVAPFTSLQEIQDWVSTEFIPFLSDKKNTNGVDYDVYVSSQEPKSSIHLDSLPTSSKSSIPLRIKIASSRKLIISSNINIDALSLVQHPRTLSIHEFFKMETQNRYGHGIIQSDSSAAGQGLNTNAFSPVNLTEMFDPTNVGNAPGVLPLFDNNIFGQNQIIACGDSGVDYTHCFFNDTGAMEFNVETPGNRKFVYYETIVDGEDVLSGHGTHVVGTIAGNALYTLNSTVENITSWYDGAAPAAKIFFQDIGSVENPSAIFPPDDLFTDYFPLPYSKGAKFHTNSWGTSYNGYLSYDMEIDEFMHDNQDFLVLFAAGNSGPGIYTVGSPGNSKNALIVGASENTNSAWIEYFLNNYPLLLIENSTQTLEIDNSVGASYGPELLPALEPLNWNLHSSVVLADPLDACNPLTGSYTNKIVLAARGSCYFIEKTLSAQNAGAKAIFIYNNDNGPAFRMAGSSAFPDPDIPSFMITLAEGDEIKEFLTSNPGSHNASLSANTSIFVDPAEFNKEIMAFFSSRGPTVDYRFKPDIVSPGHSTFSSRSTGGDSNQPTCGRASITPKSGTSMATPLTAGYVALLRQWLDVYHGNTAPSAATVKALAMTTTKLFSDFVYDASIPFGQSPNHVAGYGRTDGSFLTTHPDSFTFIESTMGVGAALDMYCFTIPNTTYLPEVLVTLTWLDPPGSVNSLVQLVNNLDLIVETPTKVYLGNNFTFPNDAGLIYERDVINNIEQVRFSAGSLSPGDSVSIRVSNGPTGFSSGLSQNYSLVIFGNLTTVGADCSSLNSGCPSNCSNHGTCIQSICSCDNSYAGADCANPINLLKFGEEFANVVSDWEFNYFKYVVPENLTDNQYIIVSLTPSDYKSDPDLFVTFDGPPTLSNYETSSLFSAGTEEIIFIVKDSAQADLVINSEKSDDHPLVSFEPKFVFGLKAGRSLYVGVFGACCTDTFASSYSIVAQTFTIETPDDLWWIWLIVGVVACSLIVVGYRQYHNRRASSSADDDVHAVPAFGDHNDPNDHSHHHFGTKTTGVYGSIDGI